ncbi:MAG TPA: hypothetical protein VIU36_01065, partial [Gammaproteobacteria bacterium]
MSMQTFEHLLDKLGSWLALLMSPQSLLQFSLIALAWVFAMMLDQRLRSRFSVILGEEGKATVKTLAMRGSQRLILPMAMLLIVILVRSLLDALAYEVWLLDIFVPLLLSLAIIRITVFLLRRAYTPSPLIKAWESIISTSIWLIVVL